MATSSENSKPPADFATQLGHGAPGATAVTQLRGSARRHIAMARSSRWLGTGPGNIQPHLSEKEDALLMTRLATHCSAGSRSFWAFCVSLCLCLGCGGPEAPKLEMVPTTAKVFLDGKPLAGTTVMFNPLPGTSGNGGFGVTDAEGHVAITDYQSQPGCPAGEYGVTFSKITQPDGSPIPAGAQRGEVGMVEQIPPVYNEFKSHTIIQGATVKGPESSFEFRLESKLKPPPSFYQ